MTERPNSPIDANPGSGDTNPGNSDTDPSSAESGLGKPASPLRIRYRVRFAKRDLLRWISHRDLARLWERLLRRARLVLSMTEGFHPKPRVSFPSALALGVESLDEVVELELAEDLTAADLLRRLQADRQPGLTIHRVERLPEGFGKAKLQQSDYRITRPDAYGVEAVRQAIDRLMQQSTVSVQRKKKTLTVDLASQVADLRCDDDLLLSLYSSESASLRPADVLDLLGFSDWGELGSLTTRVRTILHREIGSSDAERIAVAADAMPDVPNEKNRNADSPKADIANENERSAPGTPANESISKPTDTKPTTAHPVGRSHR